LVVHVHLTYYNIKIRKSHRITSFDIKLGVDVVGLVGHGFTRKYARMFGNDPPLAWGPNMGIQKMVMRCLWSMSRVLEGCVTSKLCLGQF
jgi:hypothetical protein